MRAVATTPLSSRLIVAGCLAAFVAVFLRNLWVVDDAFITFRVVENFANGLGLTWNPGERVQVFTHPLWMLVMSGVRSVTGELFFSCVAVSLAACLAALEVASRGLPAQDAAWRFALLAGLVVSSKSVMDYAASGLENALTYLLVAAFVLVAARVDATPTPRGVAALWLLASLAFVNRHDAVLLCLPGAAWLSWRAFGVLGRRVLPAAALGLLPAILWLSFATFYFGFPLPNTWYAKAAVALPLDDRLRRGYAYFGNSLAWDGLTHAAVLAAAWLAYTRRDRVGLSAVTGCALYYGFILLNASATHMGLRFFSVPFFLALVTLARLWPERRTAIALGAVLVVWNLAWPMAPWKMGSPFYRLPAEVDNHIDTNGLVHLQGPHVRFGRSALECLSEHPWFRDGLAFRERPERLHVGGPGGGEPMGYFGYAAGPTKHIVDYCALTDPLLSHLPTCTPAPRRGWKSGHFYRMLPEGYLESLITGENRIANPAIRAYYDDLRLAARSPDLWSLERMKAIWRLNTGGGRALPTRAPVPEGSCRSMGERRGPVPGS
jgi:arabinofuranosyltransferase